MSNIPVDAQYVRDGLCYRKIEITEQIPKGAMHSFNSQELHPIVNDDTVGDLPSLYSSERDFYAPIMCKWCDDHLEPESMVYVDGDFYHRDCERSSLPYRRADKEAQVTV